MLLLTLFAGCEVGGGADGADATDSTDSMDSTDSNSTDSSDSSDSTDTGDGVIPTVLSTTPASDAIGVALNASVAVTFSEAMDADTLDGMSFIVSGGDPPINIEGTVVYADSTAVFWPAEHFESDTSYLATVSTDAQSSFAVALAEDHVWSFTTGSEFEPGLPVNLGTAGDFAALAKAGISTVPGSSVIGDLGVSPAAATYITGFSLTVDASNTFATSTQVTGMVYASDYAAPTPAKLTTAVSDMEIAFTDAGARAPDVTELGAGNIGGMTLDAGVYKWGTGLLIPTDVTLDGSPTDVWIFQIAGDLIVSSATNVKLSGGALPENVFWSVAGLVEFGTTSHVEGNILTQTSITMRTGSSLNGRMLAQTAVDIDSSTIVRPTP
jgi:hypothetical protein